MGETRENEAHQQELLHHVPEEEDVPNSAAKIDGEGVPKGKSCIHVN